MIILTDQDGLFDADPRHKKDAELVKQAAAGDASLMAMAGGSSSLGRGGMQTKISAARLAARSGTCTIIANGREPDILLRLLAGEELGTALTPESEPVAAKKRWLAGQLRVSGQLQLDTGAVQVLEQSGRSLLAVGVQKVSGTFERGDVVICADNTGREIARGLVNYSSDEVEKLKGIASNQIESILGYSAEQEIIHRDNLVLNS